MMFSGSLWVARSGVGVDGVDMLPVEAELQNGFAMNSN
jgi:hypothetical protein